MVHDAVSKNPFSRQSSRRQASTPWQARGVYPCGAGEVPRIALGADGKSINGRMSARRAGGSLTVETKSHRGGTLPFHGHADDGGAGWPVVRAGLRFVREWA